MTEGGSTIGDRTVTLVIGDRRFGITSFYDEF